MNDSSKSKVIHELYLFLIYTLFFTFFLSLFGTYKRLILKEYAISYIHYGFNFIEALILSKVLLLGQKFNLGARFEDKPLIYSVVYKTLIFSLFAFIFGIIEHFFMGFIRKEKFGDLYKELIEINIDQIFASAVVMSTVFFLFFAFFELARVLGEKKLIDLFFRRTSS